LNVSRDQLDRFGEVDTVAAYVGAAMQAATEGIVTNARDPHLYKLADSISKSQHIQLKFFGAAKKLNKYFPSDYELAAVDKKPTEEAWPELIDAELVDFSDDEATYKIGREKFKTKLKLSGQHNYLNA